MSIIDEYTRTLVGYIEKDLRRKQPKDQKLYTKVVFESCERYAKENGLDYLMTSGGPSGETMLMELPKGLSDFGIMKISPNVEPQFLPIDMHMTIKDLKAIGFIAI